MHREIAFAALISCSLNLYCQNPKISGLIKDSDTNLPIPYTYIYIKGTSFGTISNLDGRYVFFMPGTPTRDSIVVSCVGYSTRTFSLQSINDSIFNVSLKPSLIMLQGVTVVPLNIKPIFEKAQQKINENYPAKPSILKGVFHQSLKQDNSYVRLVDAAVEIYQPTYRSDRKESNQIKLLNAKASFDNSIIGSQLPYQPYIILDLLFFNNTIGGLMKSSDSYEFHYSGLIKYENTDLYVIDFNSLGSIQKPYSTKGTVYIDKETYAIVSFRAKTEKQYENKVSFNFNESHVNATLKFKVGEGRIDFVKLNSKWILNYIGAKDVFSIRFNDNPELYNMEFFSELFINESNFDKVIKFKEAELINPREDLYKQVGNYDDSIWDSFNRLMPTDFEKKIGSN